LSLKFAIFHYLEVEIKIWLKHN